MSSEFPLLGRRRIARTAFLTFDREYRWTPSGGLVRREVVRHPESVVVIPWDGTRVHLLRQYRSAVDRSVLELPAGKLDIAGEPPEDTAIRESIEEIGLRPATLTLLQRCWISPGFTDELSWIYLAEDLERVTADPQGAEEVHAEQVSLSIEQVIGLVDRGEIRDATTLIGLLALLRHLGR